MHSPALLDLHLICADTVGCNHLYYVYAGCESGDGFGWGGFCLVSHYTAGEVADYDVGGCGWDGADAGCHGVVYDEIHVLVGCST